ncbi:MAG: SH3 domain-containing protein, partial [Kiritimatiellae bacterium]|nr:SH3 domain-containing protein [Kiritimatiellia bacterium]
IDSQIICRLKEGDRVTVKGRSGDWLKIAPPSGCVLYISRKYVENVLSPRKKPPVKRVKAARSPKVVDRKPPKPVIRLLRQQTYTDTPSVVSRPPAPPAPKYDDVFHREMLSVSCTQGKKVIYDGLLRKSGPIPGCPGQYRLAARDSKGRALTRCYVKGNSAQLASFLGRRLRIEGTEYWLHGIRLSVVVPERIVLEN